MGAPFLPEAIPSFREALGLAFELADHYPGRTHAIATDSQGCVQSVVKTDAAPFSITAELSQLKPRHQKNAYCLVLTSQTEPIGAVKQADLVTFSLLSIAAASFGRTLLDWIVVDADDARSFCYLYRPEQAWANDAAEARSADYLMMVNYGAR